MFDYNADSEYLLAQVQLVLFMLGMGATLAPADFVSVAWPPRALVLGGACQFLLTPVLAVALDSWLDVGPGIAVGLILIAALPGGQMAKLFTYLARGNVALSVSLTACGTLASLLTVPLLLEWLAAEQLRDSCFTMPMGRVLRDMTLCLLLPLMAGMTFGRLQPGRRAVFTKTCIRLGLVFVAVMIVGSLTSGRMDVTAYGWRVPVAIILFCLLSQQLSMLPFRLLRWSPADCVAVGIEVTMRNVNLALLLKALLFPSADAVANGVLFVVFYYGGTALLAGMPLALHYRRKLRGEPGASAPGESAARHSRST
jgi:BASS family bile acid:Na+ symporter